MQNLMIIFFLVDEKKLYKFWIYRMVFEFKNIKWIDIWEDERQVENILDKCVFGIDTGSVVFIYGIFIEKGRLAKLWGVEIRLLWHSEC